MTDLHYEAMDKSERFKKQRAFGYTQDELNKILIPMVTEKKIQWAQWVMTHHLLF